MGKPRNQFDIQQKCPSNKNHSRGIKVKRDPIKVTYISSPMMVKASNASEFRAIVQELTGKNSDVVSHDYDVVSTTTLSTEEESVQDDQPHLLHSHQQVVDQGEDVAAQDHHHHDYLLDDAFSNNIIMSLFDQGHDHVDERFLWREILSAECNSSFGF